MAKKSKVSPGGGPPWVGYGPAFIGGQLNIMSPQKNEQLIKNDLISLLLTLPGERIYRPTFGCVLRNFPFEQADDNDLAALRLSITDSILDWEPRVTVKSVDLQVTPDQQQLSVIITVVPNSNPLQPLIVQVSVGAGGSTTAKS